MPPSPVETSDARASERGIRKLTALTRLMIFGDRQPLARTPKDAGLDYEDVEFPATDGVSLKGWFIRAGDAKGPAVIFVHGWLWNRLGNAAGRAPFADRDVDQYVSREAADFARFFTAQL